MIFTEFLATYGTAGDSDAAGDLGRILVNLETFFDIKLAHEGTPSYPRAREEVIE